MDEPRCTVEPVTRPVSSRPGYGLVAVGSD
jgi:hypothetical protein